MGIRDTLISGPLGFGTAPLGNMFRDIPDAEADATVEAACRLAQRHQVPVKAAALQFSLAHPASAAVIPGASRPERIAEDRAALTATIPGDFWSELRAQRLVSADAPLPIDR